MLKTVAITSSGGGGNGTVTNVATGTGLTGGPITTTGTIALANTTVTAGTYGNGSAVSQVVINAQGQVTSASNVGITISYDGAIAHDYIQAGSTLDLPGSYGLQDNSAVGGWRKGTKVYVSGVAAGAGYIFLTGYYLIN